MSRPLRIEMPEAIYHVTNRGNGRQAIVVDDQDRDRWMRILDRVVAIFRWRVFSFALLDNHYHLLFQTPEPNLSKGMQEINGSYAGYFNVRHGRVGHVFQGRFKAVVVESEGHWDTLSRYIHLNPVRAGLVSQPTDWAWSSFRGYWRPSMRVRWVDYGRILAEFGGDSAAGRRRYGEYVSAGLAEEPTSPLESAVHGLVLGSEEFAHQIMEQIAGQPETPELPQLRRMRGRPSVARVIDVVAAHYRVDPAQWGQRRRDNGLARAVAAFIARRVTRESLPAIAHDLGYVHPSSVGAACRRVELAMKDKQTAKAVEEMIRRVSLLA